MLCSNCSITSCESVVDNDELLGKAKSLPIGIQYTEVPMATRQTWTWTHVNTPIKIKQRVMGTNVFPIRISLHCIFFVLYFMERMANSISMVMVPMALVRCIKSIYWFCMFSLCPCGFRRKSQILKWILALSVNNVYVHMWMCSVIDCYPLKGVSVCPAPT